MPKAAVYEDGSPVLVDDNVRAPWQTRHVQAEPDTPVEEAFAQDQFRLGVFPTDSAHHLGADVWFNDVSQVYRSATA